MELRDYQRPTRAVVPISAFWQTPFIKIKGSFFPFASLYISSPLLSSLSIGPSSVRLTDCERGDSPWAPGSSGF